jgi:hypothetical protein
MNVPQRLTPETEDLELTLTEPELHLVLGLVTNALRLFLVPEPGGHFRGVPLAALTPAESRSLDDRVGHAASGSAIVLPGLSSWHYVTRPEIADGDDPSEGVRCPEEASTQDPAELVVLQEAAREALEKMTGWQLTVLYYSLLGYSLSAIAKARGRWERSARDAYERATGKLRRALVEDSR